MLYNYTMNYLDKITELSNVGLLRQKLLDTKIVLVGGCFDILHYGHLFFLTKAKQHGDHLMVLLETNAFIQRVKKKKPVHTQMQRAEILASLIPVDSVILLPELQKPNEEYRAIVHSVRPATIAVTQGDRQLVHKQQMAQEVGATIVEIEHLTSFSSSQLITYAPILRD